MKSHLLAFTLLAAAVTGYAADFKDPVGLQLYSLRDNFKKNVPGTMAQVHNFGIRDVELGSTYNVPPDKFSDLLKENKLNAISAHFPYERFRDDVEGIAAEAKTLGLKYAGCAWATHKGDLDEKQCRAIIDVFNKAGEALAKHGIKFFYHVHGFEFQPFGDGTLLDLMMKETNPKFVNYEMDIFWIVYPGQDPVKLLEKYGKRWELMHLKDMKKGLQTGALTGHTEVTNDVALGTGQIDIPAILKAAKKVGVKHYFIEDESPSVESQIPVSVQYLKTVKF